MNYINEVNSFWRFAETNVIDSNAMLLYLAILQMHNLSGWKKTINIANKRLEAILGVSEKTLIKHRNRLIELGLLKYTSRQRVKKSGEYMLLSFQAIEMEDIKSKPPSAEFNTADGKEESESTVDTPAESTVDTSADCSDLYKQEENKCIINIGKNNKEEFNYLLTTCQQNNVDIDDKTQKWLLKLMETYIALWIQEAIKEASIKGKYSNKYVEGILENWKKAGGVTSINRRKIKT